MARRFSRSCTLYRGSHKLPHQSQTLKRDLTAEDIRGRFRNHSAMAWMIEDVDRPRFGNYRFVIRSPGEPALPWTAFHTKTDLRRFVRAYGLKIRGTLTPGTPFRLDIPARPRFAKIVCR